MKTLVGPNSPVVANLTYMALSPRFIIVGERVTLATHLTRYPMHLAGTIDTDVAYDLQSSCYPIVFSSEQNGQR